MECWVARCHAECWCVLVALCYSCMHTVQWTESWFSGHHHCSIHSDAKLILIDCTNDTLHILCAPLYTYIVPRKKLCRCCLLNRSTKHWLILIIHGTQHCKEARCSFAHRTLILLLHYRVKCSSDVRKTIVIAQNYRYLCRYSRFCVVLNNKFHVFKK